MATLAAAVADQAAQSRFAEKITVFPASTCWWWTGALSKAHGRFWLGPRSSIIAHRFAWATAHPGEPLPEVIRHTCDHPTCVNPDHLESGDALSNRRDWATRRHRLGSPLRDTRGPRRAARAARDAARDGINPEVALAAGVPEGDQRQLSLM